MVGYSEQYWIWFLEFVYISLKQVYKYLHQDDHKFD